MKALTTFLALTLTLCAQAQEIPDFTDAQTVITSDQLEMETLDGQNHFFFKGNVVVEGTNLHSTCNEMEVTTQREPKPSKQTKRTHHNTDSQMGAIESIIAVGEVTITQSGRTATADRAEIYPDKDFIELIGNVELENEHGVVSGPRFILEKGKRARMVSDGSTTRPTVTLPSLPDLGVDEEDILKDEEDADAQTTP